jgi:hypothetical protein
MRVINSNWPQTRFALSRGFGISGSFMGDVTRGGALADSRLPRANILCPFRALNQRLRQIKKTAGACLNWLKDEGLI